MRKFLHFLYTATAMLGMVLLVLAAICFIASTIWLLLISVKQGLKGWAAGLDLLLIGRGLFNFGTSRMAQDTDPTSQQPAKQILHCRGCQNFHGVSYRGVILVCAIHPSGVEGDRCPDYESFKQSKRVILAE